ncbi:hypothetical protein [Sphingomonas sp.]|uniref:hypothetical protein n=1 Tax=Sphingomonas sp. TaxID=28214 RepID=UPI003D6D18E5
MQPLELAFGSTIKTTAGVAGNDPRLISYYGRFSGALNASARAQGASWLGTFGRIAKSSTRLAGRLVFGRIGMAITVAAIVFDAAATLWGWYEAEQAERSALAACPVGGACRIVNASGVTEYFTHTLESQSSVSNWSLSGTRGGNRWSYVQNKAAPVGSNYTYDVWWKYTGSGLFDPNYVIPDQSITATTGGLSPQAVEDLLRERGEQTQLDRQMIANLVNAVNDMILADPTTPADARQIAQTIQANPATPTTVGYTPLVEPRVRDLIGVTPTGRPISVGDPATQPPTGTDPGGGTGTGTGTIDMSVPVAPDWPTITPIDWWPSPFVPPVLSASCTNPGGSLASLGNVTIPLCEMVDRMAPVLRPVVAGASLVSAGKIILDI